MGRRPPDHAGDRAQRDRLSPGPGPVHGGAQTGSAGAATLRVVRRFGAAAGAASPELPPAVVASALARRLACRPRLRGGLGRRIGRRRIVGVRPRPRSRPPACGSPSAWPPPWRSSPSRRPACAWREPSGRPRPDRDRRVRLDRLAIPVDDRFGRRGRCLARSAGSRLLRYLGPEQGLELGRDVAPWLVRATGGWRLCGPVAPSPPAVLAWRRRLLGPAAHVGIAVDAATAAAARRSARAPSPTGRPIARRGHRARRRLHRGCRCVAARR